MKQYNVSISYLAFCFIVITKNKCIIKSGCKNTQSVSFFIPVFIVISQLTIYINVSRAVDIVNIRRGSLIFESYFKSSSVLKMLIKAALLYNMCLQIDIIL